MDYDEYLESFVADPPPEPRFGFRAAGGPVLYFEDFAAAVDYYTAVLGPPAEYVEAPCTAGHADADADVEEARAEFEAHVASDDDEQETHHQPVVGGSVID